LKERDFFGEQFNDAKRKEFYESATMITSTNKVAKAYNCQKIKRLETDIAPIKSKNNCAEATNASFNKCGLYQSIMLAKGCDVLITTNLWKEVGLTNGAKGKVKYLIYAKGEKPPTLPRIVIVEVEQYTGPSFMGMKKCVPITPVTRHWYEGGKLCTREMLPLNLGYGITIHKSQGMSMDKVIIDIGNREFACGLTYTAISRCRKIEDLAFYPFRNYERFWRVFGQKVFKMRKMQDRREHESDSQFEYTEE